MFRKMILVTVLVLPTAALADSVSDAYQRSYDQEAVANFAGALRTLHTMPSTERSTYVYGLREAWLLYLGGRYDESQSAYQKVAKRWPKAVEPRLGMLLPLMAKRRWNEAREIARGVLAEVPGNYLAKSRLAFCQFNLGRHEDALKTYGELVDAYPANMEMQAGLAWTYLRLGKKDAAKKVFERVVQVAPKLATAQQGLQASK